MALADSIVFTQGGVSGAAGQAVFGTIAGGAVTVSNGLDSAAVASMRFEVLDSPPGSAVVVGVAQDGPSKTWSFTPDKPGGYYIHTVARDSLGNYAEDFRVFGVKEPSGHFIPPFGAAAVALNFAGQVRGWAPYMEAFLRLFDRFVTEVADAAATLTLTAQGDCTVVYTGLTATRTGTLPASPTVGQFCYFKDGDGSLATQNYVIAGNGNTIDGAASLTLGPTTNYGASYCAAVQWTGTKWRLV